MLILYNFFYNYFFNLKFDLDFVNVYRVKEFTFTPLKDSSRNYASVWNCDGEIIDEAAINVKLVINLYIYK